MPVEWSREPVVCGYQRLSYDNPTLGRTVSVPVSATPAVATGAGVIAAGDDGFIRFFDRGLGKIYWQRRLDSGIYASLIFDVARRRVVVAATSGLLTCFDLRGGLMWSAHAGAQVCATPTILPEADVLVVAAFHSRCLGIALATGEVVFERRLPAPWAAAYGGSAAHRDPYASPATTGHDTAIVCCAEHALCFAADGTELWRREIGHAIKASPAALHELDQVAICAVDGRCLILDAGTGELRHELALGAKITASPAVSGGILAVGTQCDTVVGVDACSGEIAWTSPQGAPRSYTSFTVLPDGNFIATSSRGNIVCLRRDDGAFVWETSQVLGIPDHEPDMDVTPVVGPDGRMYCGSYSGFLYQFRFPIVEQEV
jgi:outer membrane protein assembly factor BamB